jgi:hypothetical protein
MLPLYYLPLLITEEPQLVPQDPQVVLVSQENQVLKVLQALMVTMDLQVLTVSLVMLVMDILAQMVTPVLMVLPDPGVLPVRLVHKDLWEKLAVQEKTGSAVKEKVAK